jgi:hypothetical protein
MKKILAFDNLVHQFNIADDGLSVLKDWIDSAIAELKNPNIISHQSCNLDKGSIDGGMLWSTFETSSNSFFSFPESDKLLNWVTQKVIEIAPDVGFVDCTSVDLTIDWMNIMYKGSFGNCHTHDDEHEPDTTRKVVAIFYLQAPEHSSDLLVIKNTRDYSSMGVSPFTISADEIFPISVSTGDLLIHKVDMPHAIGKHSSDTPRVCLVMEFRLNAE